MDALAGNFLIFNVQIALVIALTSIAARLPMPAAAQVALWRGALVVSLLTAIPSAMGISAAPSALIDSTAAVSRSVTGTPVARAWTLAELLAMVCIVGAALRLVWLGMGLATLARLRRSRGEQIDGAGPAPVYLHPHVRQPVSFGIFQPVVFLPEDVRVLSPEAREAIVEHERMHIERRDWLCQVVEELVRAVFWFHPAIWWAIDRIDLAREQVVDALVVERTGTRRVYMETLLYMAERPNPPATAAAFGARRHLLARMQLLASPTAARPMRVRTKLAAAALLAAGAAGACALPWQQRVYSGQDANIVLPSVITEVRPVYTPRAMQGGIEGAVRLATVVRPDGRPDDIEIVESLDSQHGLDEQAILALNQWRFAPGTRNGVPVPVRVEMLFTFTLR